MPLTAMTHIPNQALVFATLLVLGQCHAASQLDYRSMLDETALFQKDTFRHMNDPASSIVPSDEGGGVKIGVMTKALGGFIKWCRSDNKTCKKDMDKIKVEDRKTMNFPDESCLRKAEDFKARVRTSTPQELEESTFEYCERCLTDMNAAAEEGEKNADEMYNDMGDPFHQMVAPMRDVVRVVVGSVNTEVSEAVTVARNVRSRIAQGEGASRACARVDGLAAQLAGAAKKATRCEAYFHACKPMTSDLAGLPVVHPGLVPEEIKMLEDCVGITEQGCGKTRETLEKVLEITTFTAKRLGCENGA